MEHLLTPYANITPFSWWENAFSPQQLDWLQQKAMEGTEKGSVGVENGGEVDTSIRRSELNWLNSSSDTNTKEIFKNLSNVVASLNAKHFNFELTGFGEPLQLTNYNEQNQGMYAWHQDFGGGGISRKLSLVLQLSDPAEYEGGNLQLLFKGEPTTMRKQRGLITVFPTWTLHQVTPVVKGARQSLVAWVTGPAFR